MKFNNKVIWITGASSGIGKAIALELSKHSVKLILSSRNKAALETVKSSCQHSENVTIVALDLEKYENSSKYVAKALSCFGSIDVLINNGGISQRSFVVDTDIAVDKKIMDINFFGTIALSKALLPHFIHNKSGHFVVISSIVGKIGTPRRSTYAASKHALHGFFDSLRAEQHSNNIKVTLACPGYVKTNVSINALTADGSPQNKMDNTTSNGLLSDVFARRLIRAVEKEKEEVYIAQLREKMAIYLKRFSPGILSNLVRKVPVT